MFYYNEKLIQQLHFLSRLFYIIPLSNTQLVFFSLPASYIHSPAKKFPLPLNDAFLILL